jgi:hypothetical protein
MAMMMTTTAVERLESGKCDMYQIETAYCKTKRGEEEKRKQTKHHDHLQHLSVNQVITKNRSRLPILFYRSPKRKPKTRKNHVHHMHRIR